MSQYLRVPKFAENDLLAHWTFQDVESGLIKDRSGNRNDGTIVNQLTQTYRGTLPAINTENGYYEVPYYILDGSTEYTISFWVKRLTDSEFVHLIDNNSSNGRILIQQFNGGSGNARLFDFRTFSGNHEYVDWKLSEWQYYCASRTSSEVSIYVDGEFKGSTGVSTQTLSIDNKWIIGQHSLILSDFRIYNRALSSNEVSKLYHLYLDIPYFGVKRNLKLPKFADPDLLAHFPFDTVANGVARDRTGNGYDGDTVNQPTQSYKGTLPSIHFDRDNQQFVEMSNTDVVEGYPTFTNTFWMNVKSLSNGMRVFVIADKADFNDSIAVYFDNDGTYTSNPNSIRVELKADDGTGTNIDYQILKNVWYHITIVKKDYNISLYVDGTNIQTKSFSKPKSLNNLTVFRIGKLSDSSPEYYDGYLSDFRIYGRALTENEISLLYNMYDKIQLYRERQPDTRDSALAVGEGTYTRIPQYQDEHLIAHWTFDDVQSGIVKDATGNGFDGRTKNGPAQSWYNGLPAIKLYPSNDTYVKVGYPQIFNYKNVFSISFWSYLDTFNNRWMDILYFRNNRSESNKNIINISRNGSNDYMRFRFNNQNTANNVNSSSGSLQLNIWQFWVCVKSYGYIAIYKDGEHENINYSNMDPITDLIKDNGFIGSDTPDNEIWDGKIADLRVYNKALSATEVQELYHSYFGNPSLTKQANIHKNGTLQKISKPQIQSHPKTPRLFLHYPLGADGGDYLQEKSGVHDFRVNDLYGFKPRYEYIHINDKVFGDSDWGFDSNPIEGSGIWTRTMLFFKDNGGETISGMTTESYPSFFPDPSNQSSQQKVEGQLHIIKTDDYTFACTGHRGTDFQIFDSEGNRILYSYNHDSVGEPTSVTDSTSANSGDSNVANTVNLKTGNVYTFVFRHNSKGSDNKTGLVAYKNSSDSSYKPFYMMLERNDLVNEGNVSVVSDAPPGLNASIQFDNTSARLRSLGNINPPENWSHSINFWLKLPSYPKSTEYEFIVFGQELLSNASGFQQDNDGSLRWYFYSNDLVFNIEKDNTILQDWSMFSLVYDSDINKQSVYVNNKLETSRTPSTPLNIREDVLSFGNKVNGAYPNCYISDFRLYDAPLTEKHINELYHYGLGQSTTTIKREPEPPSITPPSSIQQGTKIQYSFSGKEPKELTKHDPNVGIDIGANLQSGLVLHLDYRRGQDGSYWRDQSGQGNDVELVGPSFVNDGVEFNSSNTEYGKIRDQSFLSQDIVGSQARSVFSWVYPISDGAGDNIISFGKRTSNNRFSLLIFDNDIRVIGEFYDYGSGMAPDLQRWNHIGTTYDGDRIRIFKNGQTILNQTGATGFNTTNNPIYLGKTPDPDNEEWLNATIESIVVYNRALSKDEVQALYNQRQFYHHQAPGLGVSAKDVQAQIATLRPPELPQGRRITSLEFEFFDGNTDAEVQLPPEDVPYGGGWNHTVQDTKREYVSIDPLLGGIYTATSSSSFKAPGDGDHWPPSGAFDRREAQSGSNQGLHNDSSEINTLTATLETPVSFTLTRYKIQSRTDTAMNQVPKDWEIYVKEDGSWVKIQTITGETSWSLGETREYTISTSKVVEGFRMQVTDNNGDSGATHIGDLKIYGTPHLTNEHLGAGINCKDSNDQTVLGIAKGSPSIDIAGDEWRSLSDEGNYQQWKRVRAQIDWEQQRATVRYGKQRATVGLRNAKNIRSFELHNHETSSSTRNLLTNGWSGKANIAFRNLTINANRSPKIERELTSTTSTTLMNRQDAYIDWSVVSLPSELDTYLETDQAIRFLKPAYMTMKPTGSNGGEAIIGSNIDEAPERRVSVPQDSIKTVKVESADLVALRDASYKLTLQPSAWQATQYPDSSFWWHQVHRIAGEQRNAQAYEFWNKVPKDIRDTKLKYNIWATAGETLYKLNTSLNVIKSDSVSGEGTDALGISLDTSPEHIYMLEGDSSIRKYNPRTLEHTFLSEQPRAHHITYGPDNLLYRSLDTPAIQKIDPQKMSKLEENTDMWMYNLSFTYYSLSQGNSLDGSQSTFETYFNSTNNGTTSGTWYYPIISYPHGITNQTSYDVHPMYVYPSFIDSDVFGLVISGKLDIRDLNVEYEIIGTANQGFDISIDGTIIMSNHGSSPYVGRNYTFTPTTTTHNITVRQAQNGGGRGVLVAVRKTGESKIRNIPNLIGSFGYLNYDPSGILYAQTQYGIFKWDPVNMICLEAQPINNVNGDGPEGDIITDGTSLFVRTNDSTVSNSGVTKFDASNLQRLAHVDILAESSDTMHFLSNGNFIVQEYDAIQEYDTSFSPKRYISTQYNKLQKMTVLPDDTIYIGYNGDNSTKVEKYTFKNGYEGKSYDLGFACTGLVYDVE